VLDLVLNNERKIFIYEREGREMPFKSNKITYGLPNDEYDSKFIADVTADLNEVLPMQHSFVGVKFYFDKESYDNCELEEINAKTAYCVMVKGAADGRPNKSRLEHHNCDGATTALALEDSTERIENGAEYFSYNLYQSQAAARRLRSSIVSLHSEMPKTYGIGLCALQDCKEQPDIIIGIVNAYQTMRLLQGYEYKTGKKPNINMGAMQAMCSELSAYPYKSGEINVSVFCPSTRFLCKWEESEMGIGIPFEKYEELVRGVIATVPSY
jgi:uncharacterized protein (DUF169 family)